MGIKKSSSSSNKIPSQPTTTVDTGGLFGSATTSSSGTTYKPTDFQSAFVNNSQNAMLQAQNAYNNREIAQEAVDNMNRQYQTDFQNNLLAPALGKGLLRGSTAQDVMSVGNQDYQNRRYQLVNDEMNRNQQMLANNLANYLSIYDMLKGLNSQSMSNNQLSSDYLLRQTAMQNQLNSANSTNWGQLLGSAGSMLGSAAGSYFANK